MKTIRTLIVFLMTFAIVFVLAGCNFASVRKTTPDGTTVEAVGFALFSETAIDGLKYHRDDQAIEIELSGYKRRAQTEAIAALAAIAGVSVPGPVPR